MYYLHAYPIGVLNNNCSDMIFICESDSAYFPPSKSRSRAAAPYILSNNPSKYHNTIHNSHIHTIIDGNYPLVITTATVVITITPFFG